MDVIVENRIGRDFDREYRIQFPQRIFDPLLRMFAPLATQKRPPHTPRNSVIIRRHRCINQLLIPPSFRQPPQNIENSQYLRAVYGVVNNLQCMSLFFSRTSLKRSPPFPHTANVKGKRSRNRGTEIRRTPLVTIAAVFETIWTASVDVNGAKHTTVAAFPVFYAVLAF